MTSLSTKWPSTPIAQPVKQLINRFFNLADTKSDDARKALSQDTVPPQGQWVHPKHVFTGPKELSDSLGPRYKNTLHMRHAVHKVYSCNEAADDLLMSRTQDVTAENGVAFEKGFCARAVVEDSRVGEPEVEVLSGVVGPNAVEAGDKSGTFSVREKSLKAWGGDCDELRGYAHYATFSLLEIELGIMGALAICTSVTPVRTVVSNCENNGKSLEPLPKFPFSPGRRW